MVCPNECKPIYDAKLKAWCFSTSEIKISCYAEKQVIFTPLIYNISAN